MDLDTGTNKHTLNPTANQSHLTADPKENITVSDSYTDNSPEKDYQTTLNLTSSNVPRKKSP